MSACVHHEFVTRTVKPVYNEAAKTGNRIHEAIDKRLSEKEALPTEAKPWEPLCQVIDQAEGYDEKLFEESIAIFEGGIPGDWYDPDIWMRYKADVILINHQGALLIDWKTGRRRPKYLNTTNWNWELACCGRPDPRWTK